jgi:hypothetical protein
LVHGSPDVIVAEKLFDESARPLSIIPLAIICAGGMMMDNLRRARDRQGRR